MVKGNPLWNFIFFKGIKSRWARVNSLLLKVYFTSEKVILWQLVHFFHFCDKLHFRKEIL